MRAMVPLLLAGLVAATPAVQALPWSKDMVDQPAVKAQEARVERPDGVVPVTGSDEAKTPASLAEVAMFRLEAARDLRNPEQATDASVARGKVVYETHCSVCHGTSGTGDGPVGLKFVPPPMDLTTDYVQLQADGQLYYTITHGGIVMPFYRDAIVTQDRWHLINYLKREFSSP